MSEPLNLTVTTKALTVPDRIILPPATKVRLIGNDTGRGITDRMWFAYPVDGRFEHEVGFKANVPAATISSTTGLATKRNGRPTRIRVYLERYISVEGPTAYYDVAVCDDNDTVVFDYRGGINRYEVEGESYSVVLEQNGSVNCTIEQWFYKRTFKSTT